MIVMDFMDWWHERFLGPVWGAYRRVKVYGTRAVFLPALMECPITSILTAQNQSI
jgi:hypothetical protein